MNNFFKDIFAKELAKLELPLSGEEILASIEFPADAQMGDVAFPCFRLAKEFKKAPPLIANELREKLQATLPTTFGKIETKSGYINAFFNVAEVLPLFCAHIGKNNKLLGTNFDAAGKKALI